MTYQPNIPQATDIISVSQGDLLVNFQQLNTVYGTDHYAYDSGVNVGLHQHVTLPDTTATPPTPAASQGAIYGKTTAAVTVPYYRRDGLAGAPEFSMLPIRAFGIFSGAGATLNALNCTATRTGAGLFDVNISANVVSGTSYLVIPSIGITTLNANRMVFYNNVSAIKTQLAFRNSAGTLLDPDTFSIIILQV